MTKFDFKKQPHYKATSTISIQDIPPQTYLAVDGQGHPAASTDFDDAIPLLYAVSYAIRMSPKKGNAPKNYQEYTVGPLEGLWWVDGAQSKEDFRAADKKDWRFTLMIPQPEFVSETVAQDFIKITLERKPDLEIHKVYVKKMDEKQALQVMHIGPYDEEEPTIDAMHEFAKEHGYAWAGHHHEIYLSDPRRVAPEKLKTILRHPVKK